MLHTINLTDNEVKTLKTILNLISGSPNNSPRYYADTIMDKLVEIFPEYNSTYHLMDEGYVRGDINFSEFKTVTTRLPF